MKHLKGFSGFFSLILAVSFNGFSQLSVIEYELDNGMKVILNPDKTVNKVFGAVAVNTGSKNDPIDATGISHYLEHLLFKGTDKLGTHNYEAEKVHLDSINYYYDELGKTTDEDEREKIQLQINKHALEASKYAMPNEFDKLLKEIGSTGINATTGRDLTWYYNTFPSHQLFKWMDLYAHRFTNPVFRSFQSELEVVYEEKNRARDNMERRLFESFNKSFYKGHPYGEKNTLGTIEHLKNPSLTKMYNYYKKYYVANNMALILSGNFNPEEVKPQIESIFGQLKKGADPRAEIPAAASFDGREVKKDRLTPIKVGMVGFRTVPHYHPDELTIDVISNLLQNEAGTGLIDQLMVDNELMGSWVFQSNEDEAGEMMFIFIPKILVQSLKKAESLVLEELNKIKNGEFTDQQLQVVKNELYNAYQTGLEGTDYRGYLFARMFTAGKSWDEVKNYTERLEAISKAQIQEVANKYFGEDYMVFHSRTGFPKKKKLEKPKFKAVKVDQSKSSEYAQYFKELKQNELTPRFIDFEKDLDQIDLGSNNKLYVVKNPINDIYDLNINYEIGQYSMAHLEVLAEALFHAYPKGSSRQEFKDKIGLLGSTYRFNASGTQFNLNISGIEKNMPEVLQLINEMMNNPQLDEKSLKLVRNMFKTAYKAEKKELSTVPQALAEYAIVGDRSSLLNRPSYAEIKKMDTSYILQMLDSVKIYSSNIHYTGTTDAKKVKQTIDNNYTLSTTAKSKVPYLIPPPDRKENEILIVENSKKLQTTMYFIKNTPKFDLGDFAGMNLFNSYFGGGFSGIVTQEIREYRSLAYATAARFRYSSHPESNSLFYTYVACQADKTNEAVEVAFDLINEMPQKEDRIDMVRSNVKLSLFSNFPNFRNLSTAVQAYQMKGYTKDPNIRAFSKYQAMQFSNIYDFYSRNIQKTPTVLGIYGDAKRFDKDKLEQFGKVKVLKVSDVIKF